MKTFNVLEYNFNFKKVESCDVIPYFVRHWKEDKYLKKKVVDKATFKEWVISTSQYQFWSRCEYEFLIAPWPYNEEKDRMEKIDVHFQIMQNIDILVDILIEEFKLKY